MTNTDRTFRKTPPIMVRESDGLQFEPTVQPGVVRCEACLGVVEPSKINEHKCRDWWNPESVDFGNNPEFRANKLLKPLGN